MVFQNIGAYERNTSISNKLVKVTGHNKRNSVSCKDGMHLTIRHFGKDVLMIILTYGLNPVSRLVS